MIALVMFTVAWSVPASAISSFQSSKAQETSGERAQTFEILPLLAQVVLNVGDTAIFELQDGSIVKGRLLDKLPAGYLIRLLADDTTRVLAYEQVVAFHVTGASTAPAQPAPAQPVQPAPAQPVQPAPAQPAPVQPVQPAPVQPVQPAPAVAPVAPAPPPPPPVVAPQIAAGPSQYFMLVDQGTLAEYAIYPGGVQLSQIPSHLFPGAVDVPFIYDHARQRYNVQQFWHAVGKGDWYDSIQGRMKAMDVVSTIFAVTAISFLLTTLGTLVGFAVTGNTMMLIPSLAFLGVGAGMAIPVFAMNGAKADLVEEIMDPEEIYEAALEHARRQAALKPAEFPGLASR